MDEAHRGSGSQTVDRALQLLECFSVEEPQWGLASLSRRTKLNASTTRRLLRSLLQEEFVVLDKDSKLYALGPSVVQLASSLTKRGNLHAEVLPEAHLLRRRSGETVSLHLLVDDERVCILELVSQRSIQMSSGLGHRYSLHRGAAGKALLAALPEAERLLYFQALTRAGEQSQTKRATEQSQIERDLDASRARGFAASQAEVLEDAVAVAVAICGPDGLPLAALNVTGPSMRWSMRSAISFAPEIVRAVERIESRLFRTVPLSPRGDLAGVRQ